MTYRYGGSVKARPVRVRLVELQRAQARSRDAEAELAEALERYAVYRDERMLKRIGRLRLEAATAEIVEFNKRKRFSK